MALFLNTHPTPEELIAVNRSLEDQTPRKIVETAIAEYGGTIILACSFGAEDVVLADMMFRSNPGSTLFYLDTDFLFPETHAVRDRIIQHYQLKDDQIIQVKSTLSPSEQATNLGKPYGFGTPINVAHSERLSLSHASWQSMRRG